MGKVAFHGSASAAPHGKGDRLLRDNAIIKGVAHPDYGDEALTSPTIPDEPESRFDRFVPAQRSLLLAPRASLLVFRSLSFLNTHHHPHRLAAST